MTNPSKTVPQKDAQHHDERTQRLAAALRENLKRRKAQMRAKEENQKPAAAGKTGG